jgi:hypothetical protein
LKAGTCHHKEDSTPVDTCTKEGSILNLSVIESERFQNGCQTHHYHGRDSHSARQICTITALKHGANKVGHALNWT